MALLLVGILFNKDKVPNCKTTITNSHFGPFRGLIGFMVQGSIIFSA